MMKCGEGAVFLTDLSYDEELVECTRGWLYWLMDAGWCGGKTLGIRGPRQAEHNTFPESRIVVLKVEPSKLWKETCLWNLPT